MRTRGPLTFGFVLILVFFGAFGSWAALAPLDSAAIAPGFVVVEGNRKQIGHLEGGIVEDILVDEGTHVEAGQTLIVLDETQARVKLELLRAQYRAAAALVARLAAERDQLDEIAYPDWLVADIGQAGTAEILEGQNRIFAARREAVASQTRILEQRSVQIQEEITGLEAEISAQDEQLQLLGEEEQSVLDLIEENFESRPRLLALQRQISELEGERAQNLASVARARQSIGENELRAVDLGVQILNDAVQNLRDEQTRLADLTEQIRAAEDVLHRTTIVAPVAGRVVDLKLFTEGGVVRPRETIMDIVPEEDALIVSARVSPVDIDVVHAGLPVRLRFTALNRRITPTLVGEVINISADRLTDERNGYVYFEARISIDPEQPDIEDFTITPGMPVEAMIVTGERTTLQYLTKPIMNSFNRALTED